MTDLKPCPNPSCEEPGSIRTINSPAWSAYCVGCGMAGPISFYQDSEAEAAELWNALPRTQQWIPVSERLPTIKEHQGQDILALWDDGEIVIWSAMKLIRSKGYATHWMPLPPREEGKPQ